MSHSPFIWYELVTTDPQAASRFYADVVGWTPKPFPGGQDYIVLHAGDTHGAGGIMAIPEGSEGMPPMWLGYIHAADVDAKVSELKAEGGAVLKEPTDIPGVGRFSVVADPQGAVFMLMAPQGEDMPPLPHATPGTFGWRDLEANDLESAFAFYAKLFGWTKGDAMPMGPLGDYQLFHAGGDYPVGGMMNKKEPGDRPMWHFYTYVDAIGAARERVIKAGGKVSMEPMEVPGGEWAMEAIDPQGARFGLVSPNR
jgi:predicted enzyme related to lactoylglutathione lyase